MAAGGCDCSMLKFKSSNKQFIVVCGAFVKEGSLFFFLPALHPTCPPEPTQTCTCQIHLLVQKCEQGTVYIIICLFYERAAYIVVCTWNSSLRELAPDFLLGCLSGLPARLECWHISMARDEEMSAPEPVLKTTTQEACVTSLAYKK